MITVDEIIRAIDEAPADKKLEKAQSLLEQYEGEDKALIEGDILATACNRQAATFDPSETR